MEKLRTHQEVMESLKQENVKYKKAIEASERAIENVNKLMQQIVRERKRQGLSQRELAEMTGLNQSSIARFETLETTPTIITLIKITNALNLSVNALTQSDRKDKYNDGQN